MCILCGSPRLTPSSLYHFIYAPIRSQADTYSHLIRRIVISSGLVSTLAGSGAPGSANGAGTLASFSYPFSVAMDSNGTVSLVVSRYEGVEQVLFCCCIPAGVSRDILCATEGGWWYHCCISTSPIVSLYVYIVALQADMYTHLIRRIVLSSGLVSTLAGTSGASGSADGLGTAASFYLPTGVAMDAAGTVAVAVSGAGEGVGYEGR